MNILMLGAPGSGKGTQSEFLCSKKGFKHLSTGDLFRKNISEETKVGLWAKDFIIKGLLVPDEVTNKMVEEFLENDSDNLIFDGYPRNIEQAVELDKMLANNSKKLDYVIYLDIDDSILVERIINRLVCPTCKRSYHKLNRKPKVENICDFDETPLEVRDDDVLEKVNQRLQTYNEQTKPLIDFYKNRLKKIDSNNKSPNEIFKNILDSLGI
ncbi:adenylate kinase [Spiroplasma turonicum]|uniref:Adenylate kinase n=1 Tax=Spiroplasma turonicum TaxID=216946 RepID=A0A0K1P7S6_9MOLU|nr:adenylate kinase [Spiroplasma turonicum]AKU80249.1 adenylate kinase [Spiroplasma turonicum]ALX71250.1 adenylate kinase [Spiroplasma turonicum]